MLNPQLPQALSSDSTRGHANELRFCGGACRGPRVPS